MLFWCEPEEGCEVARRLELCRGSNRGGDSRSRYDTDPGDGRQPTTGVVVSMPGPDRLLDLLDASLQITELVCHRGHRDPGMRWDAAIGWSGGRGRAVCDRGEAGAVGGIAAG